MNKLYFIYFFIFSGSYFANAQDANSCLNAIPVTNSTYSVGTIDGNQTNTICTTSTTNTANNAEWYVYTAAADFTVNITSDLPQNSGTDTRLHVYSGTCGALICVAGNDDVTSNNFASSTSFAATAGEVYYLAWDNRWSSSGFDFQISVSAATAPSAFAFSIASLTKLGVNRATVDMNGDGLDDTVSISSDNISINYQTSTGFDNVNIPTTNAVNTPTWSLAAADYDGNGYTDLLYGGGSGVTFMKANDTGTSFTQISGNEYVFSQRSNFIDINNDGHLDAFVCHDVAPNVYYINDGNGNLNFYQGADPNGVPSGLGLVANGGNYGTIWIDYDNDRDMDLFIAKCRGGSSSAKINELHRNNGDGTFTNVAALPGVNLADPIQTWSTAWGDYDNDGDMDVFIGASSLSDGGHKMMQNNGNGTFTDVTSSMGPDVNSLGTDIENVAADFDNDGFIDILTDGNIMGNNGDGTFTRFTDNIPSNGAVGDLNNDGYLDVLNSANLHLNNGGTNKYLKIKLIGTRSNSNGIGARIEVNSANIGTQIREIRSGEGFRFMGSLNAHFGLGTDVVADINVFWPSGAISTINAQSVNEMVVITEPNNTASLESSATSELVIYPNPANSKLYVELPEINGNMVYSVFDTNGRRVLNASLTSNEILIQNLSKGFYFLRIVDGNQIKVKKFLKE
ncbi:MAG: FG-GAP-like repeat-containing protein [Nonlabens sp.]|uniref:FG-GAP-like repeat-containing protein n=1 Tax=Nonlabens sp. TaxID=1888209 RepID=UPI00321B04CE